MPRVDDVCQAVCETVGQAIRDASVVGSTFYNPVKEATATVEPGQVLRGTILVTEFVNIAAAGDGQWQVVIWPQRAKPSTRFSPYDGYTANPPVVPLTVTRTANVLSFSLPTTIVNPLNIHTVLNHAGDAYVQAISTDSADGVATKVANAINTLALSGVSAIASGNQVTITGATFIACNIGGAGTVTYEVERQERQILVDVWASDPHTRSLLEDAIEQRVGTTLNTFVGLPDNTGLYLANDGSGWDDDSQSSYSVYIGHLSFTTEYGIMFTDSVVQLGAVENLVTATNASPATIWVG